MAGSVNIIGAPLTEYVIHYPAVLVVTETTVVRNTPFLF